MAEYILTHLDNLMIYDSVGSKLGDLYSKHG